MITRSAKWIRHWRNRQQQFGWLAIALHWSSAALVIALLALGLWMVGLSYYSQWYYPAPTLHKSLGTLFALLLLLRSGWRLSSIQPVIHGTALERRAAHLSHILIYWLLFAITISGYLMVTATGSGISVFGWFEIPATPLQSANQADVAGWWHRWLCYLLIALLATHIAAALIHQWIKRDGTLSRMLGRTVAKD